ncbi:hypothetical protein SprV_0200878200 [Sparganum proliferum]
MNKRAKITYYAATDNPSLPSTSSVLKEQSPEPQMPHLSPEVSIVGLCWLSSVSVCSLPNGGHKTSD